MKRVQSACLNQTIRFQLKENLEHDLAAEQVKTEYENNKRSLERSRTKYKIIEENMMEDGSITIQIKKQVNDYDTGDYLS